MAACCTTVVMGDSSCLLAVLSNGRPQSYWLCRCCARVPQRTSFLRLGDRLVLTKETTTVQRRRSRGPTKLQVQLQANSTSPSTATDDSSEFNVVEGNRTESVEGNRSERLMSIEEKNAIMEFEGLTSTDSTVEEEEKGGSSDESLELSSEEDKERNLPVQAVKTSEDVGEVQRRSPPPKSVTRLGAGIASIITLFVGLLERPSAGDGKLIAGAGSAVLERVEEEVDKLRAVEDVDGQHLFEILRVVKLLQMDLQLIAAARKESTMSERLNQTKAHCRQLFKITTIL